MKKTTKKTLSLATETLRTLDAIDLQRVDGGLCFTGRCPPPPPPETKYEFGCDYIMPL